MFNFYIDHVQVKVQYTNKNTILPTDTVLKPYKPLMYHWGKCASYDLKDYEEQIRFVTIESPVEVDVIVHSKEQSSIPQELSIQQRLDASHNINKGDC